MMNKDMLQASEEDRLRMMNLCAPRVPTPSDHFEEFASIFILEADEIDVPEWPTFEEAMGNDS